MSENQSRGMRDLSMYDAMKTEELEEILRLDCEACEGEESDTELLLYVMEVLARRKKNSENPGITAQQAWESFQTNYLTEEESISAPAPKKSKPLMGPWLRHAVAAAAVIAILVGTPVVARAFGWEDIWNAVATWAKETFSFVTGNQTGDSEPSPANSKQYTSLQEALSATNRDSSIVPKWIPEGYALKDFTIGELPKQKTYNAIYNNGDTDLTIYVQAFLVDDPEKVEIGQDPIEIYEASGVEYYIFKNIDQTQVIWQIDSYECCISCELTMDEIKLMIDSIGKG